MDLFHLTRFFIRNLVAFIILEVAECQFYDCPLTWVLFEQKCYHYTYYPELDYNGALSSCNKDGASLVSVNTVQEHNFIVEQLRINDASGKQWYTSGIVNNINTGDLRWEGDGSMIQQDMQWWFSTADRFKEGRRIVYTSSGGVAHGWSRVLSTSTLPYICEISQAEAYRIDQENRDFNALPPRRKMPFGQRHVAINIYNICKGHFGSSGEASKVKLKDTSFIFPMTNVTILGVFRTQAQKEYGYGSNLTDPLLYPRGPVFTLQPQNTILLTNTEAQGAPIAGVVECFADGNPLPTYRIIHITVDGTETEITSDVDSRYALTGGRLVIANPVETLDSGTYQCEATNEYGSALSDAANVTFGALSEFSNVQRAPVVSEEHLAVAIECDPPTYKPAVTYQWYRASDGDFVRPDLNPRAFISSNGKLYFSEVTQSDATDYICLVKLAGSNIAKLATEQPPSTISRPITLDVLFAANPDWGPVIADDFIATFPNQPLRGNTVRLECLAYGTLPLEYTWTRKNFPIPEKAEIMDNNRILEIPDIQLDDGGTYTCSVARNTGSQARRDHHLTVEAKPFFVFPLKHQHADVGSQLTWRCEAKAVPSAIYFWTRNGVELTPKLGEIDIQQNVLIIYNLNAQRHSGIYQCAAFNVHGLAYSTAQLRVLAFKPSFAKHPLNPSQSAAIGGTVTIICAPEAAPKPEYTWTRNGVPLNLQSDDGMSRVRKLGNGNLFITEAQYGDAGLYGCTATNQFGSDTSLGELKVIQNTVITIPPINTVGLVNTTVSMFCQASFPTTVDNIYIWRFNGRDIDFTDNPHFTQQESQPGTLYIVQAQYEHAGRYECVAKTTQDEVSAGAVLTIEGPPGESAGLTVDTTSTTSTSTRLFWTEAARHGPPINYHMVEGKTETNNNWTLLIPNVPVTLTQVQGTSRHSVFVENLKPGNGYYFRVRAVNGLGIGLPSKSTAITQTPGAPPMVSPSNVGGGGGSVGTLTITWNPMMQEDQGGPGIGYTVNWRKRDSGTNFEEVTVEGNVGSYAHTVGRENFYLQYEVKVTAFNDYGPGPSSPEGVFIYSAEDMPIGVATRVYAWPFNCTAIHVSWNLIPNDRINMRGTLLGYQVNYRARYDPDPVINVISWRGESDTGVIIGLDPYSWYTVDVQVRNTAGLGPRSELYHAKTFRAAPSLYPVEVTVYSNTRESVFITWRGVSTRSSEEALEGYKVRFWQTTDDIRSATDVITDRVTTETVVWGIQKDTVYELRVMGYSRGGDGKMSHASFFTLGGTVAFDPSSSDILSASEKTCYSGVILFLSVVFASSGIVT